jgi:hypothetical protein
MAGKLDDIGVRPSGSSSSSGTRSTRSSPRKDSAPKDKATASTPYRAGIIQAGMTRFYGSIGMLMMLVKPDLAVIIMRNAENLAKSWEVLARSNPQVRRVLYTMISGTGWTMVITAHLPIIMILARDYGPARLADALASLIEGNPEILILKDIDLNALDDLGAVIGDEAPPAAAA